MNSEIKRLQTAETVDSPATDPIEFGAADGNIDQPVKASKIEIALHGFAQPTESALAEIGSLNESRIAAADELFESRQIMVDVHADTADFRQKKQICAAIGRINEAISRLVEVGS